MNPRNCGVFFFFFFSSFPSWTVCTFRECNKNWQIKEVSSFVPLEEERCWGFVCPLHGLQRGGTVSLRTQGLNVDLLPGTWQKCMEEQSCHVIPPFCSLHCWSASISSGILPAAQNYQWWPAWPWDAQRQLQNSAAENKVGLLKLFQALHSYQVTM